MFALREYDPLEVDGILLSLGEGRNLRILLYIMLVYLWLTIGRWKNYIGLAAGREWCRYSFYKTQASQNTISH